VTRSGDCDIACASVASGNPEIMSVPVKHSQARLNGFPLPGSMRSPEDVGAAASLHPFRRDMPMNIKTPTFIAFNDTRPGHESFTVLGRVTVPHPGVLPVLFRPTYRHRGGWEVVNLKFELLEGDHPQVPTEKLVQLKTPGINHWSKVELNVEKDTQWLSILSLDA